MPTAKMFDPANPKDVYRIIFEQHPELVSAKQFDHKLVTPFIPEGACPKTWLKMLRSVEYNLQNPKPATKQRRRSNCNQPRKRTNYAELVTRLHYVKS